MKPLIHAAGALVLLAVSPCNGGAQSSGPFHLSDELKPDMSWQVDTAGAPQPRLHQLKLGSDQHARTPMLITSFAARGSFHAPLDPSVRGSHAQVTLSFGGGAKANPNDGVTVDVDGAILGYMVEAKPDNSRLIRLMARSVSSSGQIGWTPLHLVVAAHPDDVVRIGPMLVVKFHPETRSYDVLAHGMPLGTGLCLGDRLGDQPTVTVNSGTSDFPATVRNLGLIKG